MAEHDGGLHRFSLSTPAVAPHFGPSPLERTVSLFYELAHLREEVSELRQQVRGYQKALEVVAQQRDAQSLAHEQVAARADILARALRNEFINCPFSARRELMRKAMVEAGVLENFNTYTSEEGTSSLKAHG